MGGYLAILRALLGVDLDDLHVIDGLDAGRVAAAAAAAIRQRRDHPSLSMFTVVRYVFLNGKVKKQVE